MSETKLVKSHGKWVAMYGKEMRSFNTMKEAIEWLEECQAKDRENGKYN